MNKTIKTVIATAIVTAGMMWLALVRAENDMPAFNEASERAAIDKVLVQYTTGLDNLDPDIYAGAFTEDAKFYYGENINQGHAAIRKIITDLQDSRKERARQAQAEGREYRDPVMHHVMTNAVVEFVDDTTATHHAYWMTVLGNDREFNVASMGHYEDVLKKINGHWKISERHLLR